MHPIIERYLSILLALFEKDIAIMSQPWMYYFVVPILAYVIFFFIKWAVLTAPVWTPFALVFSPFRAKRTKVSKEE